MEHPNICRITSLKSIIKILSARIYLWNIVTYSVTFFLIWRKIMDFVGFRNLRVFFRNFCFFRPPLLFVSDEHRSINTSLIGENEIENISENMNCTSMTL